VNTKNKAYLCLIKQYDKEIIFKKDYLQEMYQTGKTTDKKHRFQPATIPDVAP
jgi:hypothetical protein